MYRGGFRVGRRLVRIWRRLFPRRNGYDSLSSGRRRSRVSQASAAAARRMCEWARGISRRLLGHPTVGERAPLLEEEWRAPPKGHLAVYVAEKEGERARRYVVPAVYFNHPLFRELLREAEEEFGFHHSGAITFPCQAAKFESVSSRIAAGDRRKTSIIN
ncbi:auxin-responsive protein SAUR36-like [Zingiber officinale]|uniref:auxin-responsive protein SAUR36-like n=1 Tax=Zingiber officinale TaxID=94328 RepID=UPI001C4A8467|nr:auxin-responsive protein SAUR36-like [Zingiber officinale]